MLCIDNGRKNRSGGGVKCLRRSRRGTSAVSWYSTTEPVTGLLLYLPLNTSPYCRILVFTVSKFLLEKMPFIESSSDGERISSPVSSESASRERRRLRLLKLRWSQKNSSGSGGGGVQVQSFSAFRRARRMRQQSRMTKEEYLRLKHMVPAVATQPRVSKVIIKKIL